ncbi:thioredoxin family protein [Bacillus sp. Marseille-Q3570]|uniref:thioredoxin family protein n=1 Tax=Bacillus sp. Marseille-Q3570 TaxID=2963522 RepID=UPI0021B7F822|nr:thioredoxin family protein [Bacillus sp. Marseille-Q3570]
MKDLHSIEEVDNFIEVNRLSFIYISRTNCGVCHALLPKVQEMLTQFPEIRLAHVNVDDVEAIAGHLSIFTVPVLLLYVDGKEMIREARFVQMEQLQDKISRIYEFNT